jgi:hypothetical protein
MDSNGSAKPQRGVRVRVLGLLTGLLVVFAAVPSVASATLRVASHNDPAGDRTVMSYRITGGNLPNPVDFQLPEGQDTSFGPQPGVYTIQGLPPAGWVVADIQCVGASPGVFQVDVANGRVTVNHQSGAEDTCAFTNRRAGAAAGQLSTGVAPTPAPSELSKVSLPQRAALVRVTAGRRFAAATIRISRASIIRGELLWRTKRVVGSLRVVRTAGTHVVQVRLTTAGLKLLRRQGQQRVLLTMKVVVVPRSGRGTAQVFRFGVRVRL